MTELQCSVRADSDYNLVCSRHLGTGIHYQEVDDFIEEHLPDDVRVLIMTGSLIGKNGIENGTTALALLKTAVDKLPSRPWPQTWERYVCHARRSKQPYVAHC